MAGLKVVHHERRMDSDAWNLNERQRLQRSILAGRLADVVALVDCYGVSVHEGPNWFQTPVWTAVRAGQPAILRFLLSRGASGGSTSMDPLPPVAYCFRNFSQRSDEVRLELLRVFLEMEPANPIFSVRFPLRLLTEDQVVLLLAWGVPMENFA